ncbi:hypothetical protein [Burkholderia gladioli]|uniref:hypothetical protein n=1 Tax=Burkholderia gladioli TaxID=28095 RepID=UPI003D20496E
MFKNYDGAAALERTTPKFRLRDGRKYITPEYENEVIDVLRAGWPALEVCRVYGVCSRWLRKAATKRDLRINDNEPDMHNEPNY